MFSAVGASTATSSRTSAFHAFDRHTFESLQEDVLEAARVSEGTIATPSQQLLQLARQAVDRSSTNAINNITRAYHPHHTHESYSAAPASINSTSFASDLVPSYNRHTCTAVACSRSILPLLVESSIQRYVWSSSLLDRSQNVIGLSELFMTQCVGIMHEYRFASAAQREGGGGGSSKIDLFSRGFLAELDTLMQAALERGEEKGKKGAQEQIVRMRKEEGGGGEERNDEEAEMMSMKEDERRNSRGQPTSSPTAASSAASLASPPSGSYIVSSNRRQSQESLVNHPFATEAYTATSNDSSSARIINGSVSGDSSAHSRRSAAALASSSTRQCLLSSLLGLIRLCNGFGSRMKYYRTLLKSKQTELTTANLLYQHVLKRLKEGDKRWQEKETISSNHNTAQLAQLTAKVTSLESELSTAHSRIHEYESSGKTRHQFEPTIGDTSMRSEEEEMIKKLRSEIEVKEKENLRLLQQHNAFISKHINCTSDASSSNINNAPSDSSTASSSSPSAAELRASKQAHASLLQEFEDLRRESAEREAHTEERLLKTQGLLADARATIATLKERIRKLESTDVSSSPRTASPPTSSFVAPSPPSMSRGKNDQQQQQQQQQRNRRAELEAAEVAMAAAEALAEEQERARVEAAANAAAERIKAAAAIKKKEKQAAAAAKKKQEADAAAVAAAAEAALQQAEQEKQQRQAAAAAKKKKQRENEDKKEQPQQQQQPPHPKMAPPTAQELAKPTPKLSSGYGRCIYEPGEWYEGWWVEYERSGVGTYQWRDGRRYEGDWFADKKHGRGQYYWVDGDRYEGAYENDKMHGYGEYHFSDGTKYSGEWRDDQSHGRGEFQYSDGAKYVGNFQKDQKHGPGRMHLPTGEIFEEMWQNGKRISSAAIKQQPQQQQHASYQSTLLSSLHPQPPPPLSNTSKQVSRNIRLAAQEQLAQMSSQAARGQLSGRR